MADLSVQLANADRRRSRLQTYQRQIQDRVGRGRDHWASRMPWVRDPTFEDFIQYAAGHLNWKGDDVYKALMDPVDPPVHAWVSNNRWIARCECGGQETVDPEEPRFYCLSCQNFLSKGKARRLVFPDGWQEIEQVLAARVDPLNRGMAVVQDTDTLSWQPVEDLEALERENRDRGLPARRVRGRGGVSDGLE